MNRFAACVSLLLALCLIVAGAGIRNMWADTMTGSLNGKVLDHNGSAVAGATITIRNLETDSVYKTVTDTNGDYSAKDLPVGRYSVVADVGRGRTVALNMVDLVASAASATATAASAAAQISATVIVSAQSPMVEKSTSRLDRTVVTKQILELPGRENLNKLALLQPGVTPNVETVFGQPYYGIVNSLNYNGTPGDVLSREWGSAFSVNGTRPNSNYFTIDGAYNMDPVMATNRQSMPPEDIQTFQLITGNFPAEIGQYGGSFVDQLARSGSTGIHGTLNYTWAGNSLNALSTNEKREYDALTAEGFSDAEAYRRARSIAVDNRAVASAGFPIWKDRIFSFTSWDQDWFRSTVNPSTLGITPLGLTNLEDLSGSLAPGQLTALTSSFPVANIETGRGSVIVPVPTATGVVDTLVPLGTYNRGLALGGTPYDRNYWRILERMDVKVSDRNSLSMRYLFDRLIDPGYPTALPGQVVGRFFKNQSGALNDVHIFSPGVVNEFRFSYGQMRDQFSSDLGLGINIGGFNSIGNPNFPQNRDDTNWQLADFISWSKSHHNFKFGGDVIHYKMNANFFFNENGTLTYPSLTNFLLNENAIFTQFTGDDFISAKSTTVGAFAMDDWRVSKSFSLNLGLRYDYMQVPEGLYSGILPDQTEFGPRFGFAWAPGMGGSFLSKTTIRGGYSIMYDQEIAWQLLPLVARNFPRGITTAVGPVSGLTSLPAPVTVDEFLDAGGNPDLLPATFVTTNNNRRLRTPYYQTYTLGLERQFGSDFVFRAYYVGTKGTYLYIPYDANPGITPEAYAANTPYFSQFDLQPVISPTGITEYRPNPAFGSTMVLDPIGNSIYNSGQFSVEKRYSHGIQFGVHYTYSSAISDWDSILQPVPNPFDPQGYRGHSNWNQPNRLVGNYTFVVPTVMRNSPFVSRLISGWEISGVTTWASGFQYSVYNANDALGLLPGQNPYPFTQLASYNPFGVPGTGSSAGITDPTLVANPTNSGIVPALGRNTFRTGKFFNTDLAFVKNTRTFTEDQFVQLRFEAFNVFNRTNFTNIPVNVVNGSTDQTMFLNTAQTNIPHRSFMFTARYFF